MSARASRQVPGTALTYPQVVDDGASSASDEIRCCGKVLRETTRASPIRRGSPPHGGRGSRSGEHTSELQSLMRMSYAAFCLQKKKNTSFAPTHLTVKNHNEPKL